MAKLLMLRGLPASGKSTWAKEFILSQPKGSWSRINKDDLRSMAHGGRWSPKNEEMIIEFRDKLIAINLNAGVNVIVDDTNFHPKHALRLNELAGTLGAEFEIKDFEADVYDCIDRDAKRPNGVGKSVIWRMWKESVIPKVEWPKNRTAKAEAIICDLDGTLANCDHRSPYATELCEKDGVYQDVLDVVNMYADDPVFDPIVILVSGRSDKYRPETERWLAANNIPYSYLHMRKEGDTRKDWLVKFEILRDEIAPKYNVKAAFDDRDQVVAMWRAQGIRTFQVADGDF